MFTWIADYAPNGRLAEAIGIFGISGLITSATGPYAGEIILDISGGNFLYIFLSISASCGVGLILSNNIKELHHIENEIQTLKYKDLLKNTDVVLICFIGVVFGLAMSSFFTFIAPFYREYSLGKVSSFLIPYTIAAILVRIFFGKLADRSRNAFLLPGFAIIAIGQFALSKVAIEPQLLIYVAIFLGIAHGMIYPAMIAALLDSVGSANKGKGMGIINASNDLGNLTGASILGIIADRYRIAPMYGVSGIIIGTGLIIYILGKFLFSRKKLEVKNLTLPLKTESL
jgi:predicted MFS family arabinose efflux permease